MGFFDKVKNIFDSGKNENFGYLDDLIHSGTKEIVLDCDIVLHNTEKSKYIFGITLDVDDLVIDGNGHVIDARGKTRIFKCTGKNIVIKNITLKNGVRREGRGGGAIFNDDGELTIIKSTFIRNTEQEDEHHSYFDGGGAIFNNLGKLSITESTFMGNVAQDGGGAIYNDRGVLTIADSTFSRNTAQESDGGAIYNRGELTITDSTLSGNTAQRTPLSVFQKDDGGGAIYNGWGGVLTITDSTLSGNTAQKHGGAIYNRGELTITDSTLSGNTAQKGSGGVIFNHIGLENNVGVLSIIGSTLSGNTAHNGGAIYNDDGELSITGCKILSNKSPKSIILTRYFIEVQNTKFYNNLSKYVLNNQYEDFDVSIINCEFIDNDVEDAVILNNSKNFTIHKTIFENNTLTNIINKSNLILSDSKIKDDGKTILNDGYIIIKKCQNIILNQISGDGEIECSYVPSSGENFDFTYFNDIIQQRKYILYRDKAFIKLNDDIHLENYERDFYEGGIELDIDNLVIDGNGHTIDGADKSRIFIITGNNITLKNITFKNGYASDNYHYDFNNSGGAIRINYNAKITIKNCEFIKNTAEKHGGVIYNNGRGSLTIKESIFAENTVHEGNGGVIYNGKSDLIIKESTFAENTVHEGNGGAIYYEAGDLIIKESIFAENTVHEGNGGAIYNKGVVVSFGVFLKNNVTIAGSTFAENSVQKGSGGAIVNNGKLTITDSTLSQNTSQAILYDGSGGAILNNSVLFITCSALNNNTAKWGGGAINNQGVLTITDSTVSDNTAQHSGGAIHNTHKLIITGSTLTGNVTQNGGDEAIDNTGELSITDCDINNKPL